MTVYRPKGGSKIYLYDFQCRGERFYGSTRLTSKRDAEAFERDRKREAALGTKVKPSITMDEVCGLYWEATGRFQRSSPEGQLGRLMAAFGPKTAIGDLTDVDFIRYVAKRRGQKAARKNTLVSNATVNREIELCRRVFRKVEKTHAAPEIDWRAVLLDEPKERVRELSDDEERRLLDALDPDMRTIVRFAFLSGQRKSAITTLLWVNVDLTRGSATVLTKGNVKHTFPLTPELVSIIANQPRVCAQVFTFECKRRAPSKPGNTPRVKGERYPFSRDGWRRRWQAALKEAGIEDFRFHDLRHTAASRVTRTSDLTVTQRLLGHASIQTTARYAHVRDEDVRKAMIAAESRYSPEDETVTPLKPLKKREK